MNEKTKLFRNFLFLSLFSYLLFLISCNEDLEEIDGTHFGRKHSDNVKILTGNEAKLIFNQLVNESKNNKNFDILGNKLKINGKNSFLLKNSDQTTIDYSQIMQVSDLKGNVNYTFKVLNHPDDDENTFHNLVYNNQNTTSPRINLLKFDNVGANFRTTDNSTMTSASLVAASDPCPPVTTPINNPVVGNPGGGNPGGGNPGGGNPGGGSNGDNPNYIAEPTSISFQCNSCSFNSNTWEGMLTHGYTGPNNTFVVYPFSIILHRASSSQNTTIISNPCDTQGDIGVLPNLDNKKPCEELNKLIPNNSVQQTLRGLKTASSGSSEVGFYMKETTNNVGATYTSYPVIPQNPSKPYEISIGSGLANGKIKGAMHCHTDPETTGMIPMFSAADLGVLYNIAYNYVPSNNATKDYAEFTVMLSVGSGHYALKLKNFNGDYNVKLNPNLIDFQKDLEYDNVKLTSMAVSTDLIKVFLKNLNVYFGDEVGLFKATDGTDSNGLPVVTGWKEQTLDQNGNINEIDCQ